MSSLRVFIYRKGHFSVKDIFFEEKKKDGINSLQLKIDEDKNISNKLDEDQNHLELKNTIVIDFNKERES